MIGATDKARLDEELRAHREVREQRLAARVLPKTIDIPFEDLEPRPEGPRCSQHYADGRQCEAPADGGNNEECKRHLRWSRIYPTVLPFPEDALSLQEMMGYVVVCVIDKLIDADQAHAIAELCRIMEKNLWRCENQTSQMRSRRLSSPSRANSETTQ